MSLIGRGAVILPQTNLAAIADRNGRLQAGMLANKQKQEAEEEGKSQAAYLKMLDIHPDKLYTSDAPEVYKKIDALINGTKIAALEAGGYRKISPLKQAELAKLRQEADYSVDQAQQHKVYFDQLQPVIQELKNKGKLHPKTYEKVLAFAQAPSSQARSEMLLNNPDGLIVLNPPSIDIFKQVKEMNITPTDWKLTPKGSINGHTIVDRSPVYDKNTQDQLATYSYNAYNMVKDAPMSSDNAMTYGQAFPTYEKFHEAVLNTLKGDQMPILLAPKSGGSGGSGNTEDLQYQQSMAVPLFNLKDNVESTIQREGYSFKNQKMFDTGIGTDKITFSTRKGLAKQKYFRQGLKNFKPTGLIKEGDKWYVLGSMWRKTDTEEKAVTVNIPFEDVAAQMYASYKGVKDIISPSNVKTIKGSTKTTKPRAY